jgi:hypothetical protein|tara:strand:+ start:745 stop:999 length:255 start_codon:yes stop_codon:yes gene_type:complete
MFINTNKAIIKYYVDEYTDIPAQVATFDSVANIASKITQEGFIYGLDFCIHEVYYRENGRQIVAFEFKDEQRAMLIKLKGIGIV